MKINLIYLNLGLLLLLGLMILVIASHRTSDNLEALERALLERGALTGYIMHEQGIPVAEIPEVVDRLYTKGVYHK